MSIPAQPGTDASLLRPETELVILDLDGTLYDMRGLGIRLVFKFFFRLRWLKASRKARHSLEDHDFGDRQGYERALGLAMSEILGKDPDRCLDWYRGDFLLGFVQVLGHYKARKGLVPLLERLRDEGKTLTVVSAYSAVRERLDAIGIDTSLFSIIESCEDRGALKPSPKSFLAVMEQTGIGPGKTMAIGDLDAKDGEAARRAGIFYADILEVV